MSNNVSKTFLLFFALFVILITVPNSFAYDNDTNDLSINDGDMLNVANNVFYVSETGNDTNDGSHDNPLATINRALTLANSNNQSQIYIETGVYTEYNLEILSNVNITGLGNVTIDAASKGRIFTVDDELTVNFENLNLVNGDGLSDIFIPYMGYQNGAGAIYVRDATVTINNLTFIGNSAESCGGAIVWDGRNGKIKNSRFIDNYGGTYGGAIDWEGDNARIENCTFISNQAENGGALFYGAYVLNLVDSYFESNIAGWGGAISIISTSQTDDNYITGNTFVKNEADSYGGAIVLDNEQLVSCSSYTIISKNNFEDNVAAYGGAISAYYANMDVISNTFVNHTASYGGVIASSGVLYLQNNTMKNSKATTIGNEIYNVGTFEGFLNITFMEGKTVDVTGQSIRLNATVTDDMGNAISGGSVKFTVNDTETLYSPSVLTEGFCYVAFAPRLNGTYIISGNYGSVSSRYSNVTVGYIRVTNASADYFGPIYLSESFGNDANVGSEESPVATFEVAYSLANREGASKVIIIKPGYYEVSRFDITGKSFTIIGEGNPVLDAKDKFMFSFTGYASNYFNISGVTLANGYAGSSTYGGNYAGGAIFFKGGHLYLENVSFINNTAEDYGGAIHVNKGFNLNTGAEYIGEATIVNCTFINNQVIRHDSYDRNVGGAISTYGGLVTIINSTFIDNYARFGGALGIEQYHGGMTVINSTFRGNEAVRFGGAIYFDTVTPFTAEIYNSTFEDNSALTGGAIYIGDGVVDGCEFINNTAGNNAGALLVEGDDKITNNVFTNNTAANVGGAIVILENPSQVLSNIFSVNMTNNTISGCSAANASEIYLDGKLFVTGIQVTVLDNITKFFAPNAMATIYANVTDDMGNLITTNNFTFIIDGENYYTSVSDGVASIDKLITLSDNNKVVSADILTVKNDIVLKTGIIKLATGEIIVDFSNSTGILGENITIPVQVIDEDGNPIDSGILNVEFNSDIFNSTISNGFANVVITLPRDVGLYPITAQYANVSLTRYVSVLKATPTITINVSDAYVGENKSIAVNLNDDAIGNITVNVNNETFVKSLENGSATFEINNLENKTYVITVAFDGSEKYTNASANASFNVFKVDDYAIDVLTDEISEGQNLTVNVTVPEDAKSNVTIFIDSKNYTSGVIDGVATFSIENLKAGQYDLTATYAGDEKYLEKSSAVQVIVSKVSDYEINVNSTVVREGENTTVTVSLPSDAKGKVIIKVNNKTYEANVSNGTAIVEISDLKEGNYGIEVTYDGDSKYVKKSVNDNITVTSPINVKLTVDDVEKYFGGPERLTITLVDLDSNPLNDVSVYITINNVTYTRKVVNGTASMALSIPSGNYNVSVLFNGTEQYDRVQADANVIIKSTVSAADVVKIYRNGTQFYANFTDFNGNPLTSSVVTFNINGVFYNRTTNENGTAKLNINLDSGKYIITSINNLNGEKASNLITVIGKIVENNDLTKYYRNASQYTVKVLDDEGNAVGAGVEVTFNINGVFYTRTTNASGIAKLNINLGPGDYIITAEYGGYKTSNNIKVLPTLSADDLDMSYRDGQRFEARLVDGQGRAFEGEIIRFNINGVFYERSTDGDGVARLNINLMRGEYIITSSYNGLNIANTIRIA